MDVTYSNARPHPNDSCDKSPTTIMFLEYTNSHFILPVLVRSLEWSDLLLNPCLSSSRNSSAFRQRVQPGRIHRTGLWHLRNALRGIDNLSDTKSEYLRAYSHIISFKVSKIMTFRKIFSLVATHTHTHTHTRNVSSSNSRHGCTQTEAQRQAGSFLYLVREWNDMGA